MYFENKAEPVVAVSAKTAYYTEICLSDVVNSGTATTAQLSNSPSVGKTGTTSDNKDRWFAGYTPYYTGVCWYGYDIGRDLGSYSYNPGVHMWKQVMEYAHKDLERKEFERPYGVESFTYCMDSGLLANEYCRLDPRSGGRLVTGHLFAEDIPAQTCNVHVPAEICTASNCLATPYCQTTRTVALMNIHRWAPVSGVQLYDEQFVAKIWGQTPSVPEGSYPIVAYGANNTAPYNTFCPLHTTPVAVSEPSPAPPPSEEPPVTPETPGPTGEESPSPIPENSPEPEENSESPPPSEEPPVPEASVPWWILPGD